MSSDTEGNGLRRSLGPLQLTCLGVGCIIGAGIFVMTGHAAAVYAGPAIMLSFLISGIACACTALCYAELAAAMPVAGSAYSYSYAALGETFAWTTGCLLIFEYGVAVALVAQGFASYLVSLLGDFGMRISSGLTTALVQIAADDSGVRFEWAARADALAGLSVLAVTILLVFGVRASATVNAAAVILKIGILIAFIVVGANWVQPEQWTPFIPTNEGGFHYGWPGILRASALVFFAYVGFETISNAAAEARHPERDLPIGIFGALLICTLVYIGVAVVLTGIVPFRNLAVSNPVALAVDAMQLPLFALIVKVGAVISLASVMLVSLYAQTRVIYAMSRDGLLPPALSRVHGRLGSPTVGTLLAGACAAAIAACLPVSVMTELVSLGTVFAFCVVCFTVMRTRATQPTLPRPFRVPFGGIRLRSLWIGIVPTLGIMLCLAMAIPVLMELYVQARSARSISVLVIAGYALAAAVLYLCYGRCHSHLARSNIHGDTGECGSS